MKTETNKHTKKQTNKETNKQRNKELPFAFCFRMSVILNYCYMMFHNCSWSVMSVLRYVYITKKDQLLEKVCVLQFNLSYVSYLLHMSSFLPV